MAALERGDSDVASVPFPFTDLRPGRTSSTLQEQLSKRLMLALGLSQA